MKQSRNSRSLSRAARHLKRVATLEGFLWYVAGYSAVLSAYIGTLGALLFVCSLPVLLFAPEDRFSSPGAVILGGLGAVLFAGVFALCAVGGWRQAVSWRQLRLGAILCVGLFLLIPSLLITPCAAGAVFALWAEDLGFGDQRQIIILLQAIILLSVGVLWYVFVGGFAGAMSIRGVRIDARGDNSSVGCRLGTVLDLEARESPPLRSSEVGKFRRQVAWSACKTAWIILIINFGIQVLATFTMRTRAAGLSPDAAESSIRVTQFAFGILMLIVIFFLSGHFTRKFHESWQYLTPTLAEAREQDRRRPILFLRSFRSEWSLTGQGSLSFLSLSRTEVRSVEERLTDRLWRFGPVVALGRPGQRHRLSGAARSAPEAESDGDWKAVFENLARESGIIMLIAGTTEGVAWELARLQQMGLSTRLLLVLPPWVGETDWKQFCEAAEHPAMAGIPLGPVSERLLGIRWDHTQQPVLYRGPLSAYALEALALIASAEILVAPATAESDE